jgi:transposase
MYAVTTDLLDGDVKDILKFSEGRWKIEECFRVMKTDFETRPVFLHDDVRIKAHFLICFLAVVITSKEIWEMPSATRHSWIN